MPTRPNHRQRQHAADLKLIGAWWVTGIRTLPTRVVSLSAVLPPARIVTLHLDGS